MRQNGQEAEGQEALAVLLGDVEERSEFNGMIKSVFNKKVEATWEMRPPELRYREGY